jgi:hypothetical protein
MGTFLLNNTDVKIFPLISKNKRREVKKERK